MTKLAARLVGGLALGFAAVAACAGAAPASSGAGEPEELAGRADAGAAPPSAAEGDAGAPKCPYGALEDPHRGFVRCLTPDERDAGVSGPVPTTQPEGPPPEPPDNKPAVAGPPPVVEIGSPKFENGQVTKVEKAMSGVSRDIAKCVAENGGLAGTSGGMKITFLVRVRGRAEGVEVTNSKGVSEKAQQCVRLLLKNKAIGAPSADPVGVTVPITLKAGAPK